MVKILIVDDNEYVRLLLRVMLEKENYQVVGEARNKEEAVEQYKKLSPDVVLMDLRMPEEGEYTQSATGGIHAIEEIRKISTEVKIIALTAVSQERYREKVIAAGADGYITKPYKEEEIINAVKDFTS